VSVIPNGIPEEPFLGLERSAVRENLGIEKDALVFCFTSGHLNDKRKNITDAIQALRAIDRGRVTVIVLGNISSEVAAECAGFNLVAPGFIGDRKELAMYLTASDAMIFTSLAENHPLSVLEAMASGSAVIGYDTGGVPEQVRDGCEGLLVSNGDLSALKSLMKKLPDRPKINSMGLAARERFRKQFTAKSMVEKYKAFFESQISF
jgi:glycosyltransferase involved in cell wall biosynthesis